MKKSILSTALLAMIATGHAEDVPVTAAPTPTPTTATPTTQPAATIGNTMPQNAQPAAANPLPIENTAPVSGNDESVVPAPSAEKAIDCNYHISADTTTIDQSIITTWAKYVAIESFDFNPTTIDEELSSLKNCYTDQGWQAFNSALQKSGNITAIKTQHLTVSSQVDGDLTVNSVNDNQWKASVPMQVVYQNDKEKLTQLLTVDLLIGRKLTGDLGVMQIIATPRKSSGEYTSTTSAPTTTTTTTESTTTQSAPQSTDSIPPQ